MAMTLNDYRSVTLSNALELAKQLFDDNNYISAQDVINWALNSDDVTGNASGSYTFSRIEAEENVSDLIWEKDLYELLNGYFDTLAINLSMGAEMIDVLIRVAYVYQLQPEIEDFLKSLRIDEGK